MAYVFLWCTGESLKELDFFALEKKRSNSCLHLSNGALLEKAETNVSERYRVKEQEATRSPCSRENSNRYKVKKLFTIGVVRTLGQVPAEAVGALFLRDAQNSMSCSLQQPPATSSCCSNHCWQNLPETSACFLCLWCWAERTVSLLWPLSF